MDRKDQPITDTTHRYITSEAPPPTSRASMAPAVRCSTAEKTMIASRLA
jgi:hypothetical protein